MHGAAHEQLFDRCPGGQAAARHPVQKGSKCLLFCGHPGLLPRVARRCSSSGNACVCSRRSFTSPLQPSEVAMRSAQYALFSGQEGRRRRHQRQSLPPMVKLRSQRRRGRRESMSIRQLGKVKHADQRGRQWRGRGGLSSEGFVL